MVTLYRYPGTGEYDKFFEEGIYNCAGCGTPLYKSTTKFNSGCGWPAFYEGLPGAIKQTVQIFLLLIFLVILCSYVCISANKIDTFFSPIQMEWEPKSHVQLVVGTWVMYLKARGSQHLQMNVIVSIVFHSSSLLLLRAVLAVSCEV